MKLNCTPIRFGKNGVGTGFIPLENIPILKTFRECTPDIKNTLPFIRFKRFPFYLLQAIKYCEQNSCAKQTTRSKI